MAMVCPLYSGSSGNATFVGNSDGGILVDTGVSCRAIKTGLESIGQCLSKIHAIFITHEHIDHIRGLKVLLKNNRIPLFASAGTLDFLEQNDYLPAGCEVSVISPQGQYIDDMHVTPFHTPHDAAESMGFSVTTESGRRICIATDLGFVTDEVRQNLCGSDLVVLESNYDKRMLECGGYPYYLKRRILGQTGHLSNEHCAEELCYLAANGTTRFFLAHLSRENNVPELALQTAKAALTCGGFEFGSDYLLEVASRNAPSRPMLL